MSYTIFDNLALSDLHFEQDHPKPFRLFAVGENHLTRNGKEFVLTLSAEVTTACSAVCRLRLVPGMNMFENMLVTTACSAVCRLRLTVIAQIMLEDGHNRLFSGLSFKTIQTRLNKREKKSQPLVQRSVV